MKENKKFLEFADGHLEEILLYKKGEINRVYPIAITKSGIYMKIPMNGFWAKWAKIDGPICVTLESFPSERVCPNYQGTAEFSFHPAHVTAILSAENVTKTEEC